MNVKWHVLALIAILFFIKQANAQYLSVGGDFSVDQQLGCHDLTVTVTNISPGTGVIIYQFNGSESATSSNPTHTYTSPGTVWINQYIQGATGEKKDSVQVIIVAPELPSVELFSCNNLELLVQINDAYYDEYEINYGDGTIIIVPKGVAVPPYTYANNNQRTVTVTGLFTTATNRCGITSFMFDPVATVLPAQLDSLIMLGNTRLKLDYILSPNSLHRIEISLNDDNSFVLFKNLEQHTLVDTITQLNFNQSRYCFRIATYDACSNFKSYSNEICTINLDVSAQNNQLTADWITFNFGAGQVINLYRDGLVLHSFSSSINQHVDTTVTCNTRYFYQTEVSFAGGIARSLHVFETSFSTDIPPSINNISSITNNDSIAWNWLIPPNTTPAYFYVNHTNKEGTVIGKDSVSSNSFTDSFEQAPKYVAVQTIDICNNASPLNLIGASLFLEGTIDDFSDTQLKWNDFSGWIDGFQGYYITLKDKEGTLIDSIYTEGDTFYTFTLANQVNQTITFTVWAIPVLTNNSPSRSNKLTFERDPVIAIPNAFSPNGDGVNDKFIITGKFIATYEMRIFNRWGEALFQTTNLEEGWDGISNQKKLPTGNYVFWIRIKDLNNKEHIRTGSILILSN